MAIGVKGVVNGGINRGFKGRFVGFAWLDRRTFTAKRVLAIVWMV
jgi:hypothetical protein